MQGWGPRQAPWTSTPKVTLPPWAAPSMPPVRFQPVARPQAHRCPLGQEEPHWMVPIPRLWDNRTGARLHLTRTSCISSEPRSWPTRCWPGGSPSPTTCRWQCRESGRCLGCSSRCQHYLHPLCPQQDLALAPAPALARVQDQHLQIIAGLTGWEGPTCPPQDPQACPLGCQVSPPEGLPSLGLKDPWRMLLPPRAHLRS